MKIARAKIKIHGMTPLMMDRFPDTAKNFILGKQFGLSKTKANKLRNKDIELEEALHKQENGEYCFPAFAFKKGMMDITSFVGDKKFSKKLVSGSVFIVNDCFNQDGTPSVPIITDGWTEHKNWIRFNVKFVPVFKNWGAELIVEYNPENITADDIVTCLDTAGRMVGIGSWRPYGTDGGSGNYGKYGVANIEALKPEEF